MSKIAYNPNSHFFVDYTKLADPIKGEYTISKDQNGVETITTIVEGNFDKDAFGPVKVSDDFTSETNEYRTTSFVRAINATEKVNVFAICDGEVLILQQSGVGNEDKINIVLKPSQSYAPLKIKYFIYRGINKSALFNSELHLNKVIEDESDNPVLLRNIWTSYLNFNQPEYLKNGGKIENTDKTITFNQITCPNETSNDTLIENVFRYNINNQDYQLTTCKIGTILGTFSHKIGLDIVLDDGDYILEHEEQLFKFDLGFARKSEHKFDITQFNGNGGKIKKYKEHIHSFLDAAAFWGSHIDVGEIRINEQIKFFSKNDIYNNIISKYQTKNLVYLYFKTERERSLIFYNYNTYFYLFLNGEKYYFNYDTNFWPVNIKKFPIENLFLDFNRNINKDLHFDDLTFSYNLFLSTSIDEFTCISKINSTSNKFDPFNLKLLLYNNISISNFISISLITFQDLKFINYYNNLWKANIIPISNQNSSSKTINVSTYFEKKTANLFFEIKNKSTLIQQKVVTDFGLKDELPIKRRLYISSISDTTSTESKYITKGITSGVFEINTKEDYYNKLYGRNDINIYKGNLRVNLLKKIASLTINCSTDHDLNKSYFQLGITEEEYNIVFFNSKDVPEVIESQPHLPLGSSNISFFLQELDESDFNREYRKYKLGLKFENENGDLSEPLFPGILNQVTIFTVDNKFFFSEDFAESQVYYDEFSDANVHFRTVTENSISPRIIKKYEGEYGFDWFRIGDNGEVPYENSIVTGFSSTSTTNQYSEDEAYYRLKKEYIRYPLTTASDFYYVPYLNLFSKEYVESNTFEEELLPSYKAELKVLVDINSNLEKLEFDYDINLFVIDTHHTDSLKNNQLLDKFVSNGKNQSQNKTITITCLKSFSENQSIKIYAYPIGEFEKSKAKLAGEIIVLKNTEQYITYKTVEFYPVKTSNNIDTKFDENHSPYFIGKIYPEEKKELLKFGFQNLIIFSFRDGFEIDLTSNNDFKVLDNQIGVFLYDKVRDHDIRDTEYKFIDKSLISTIHPSLTEVKSVHSTLKGLITSQSTIPVFCFDDFTCDNTFGEIQGIGIKCVTLFNDGRRSNRKGPAPSECPRAIGVLSHELLHGFGLRHTHQESILKVNPNYESKIELDPNTPKYILQLTPLTPYDQSLKYVFVKENDNDVISKTQNVMGYSNQLLYTWKWQWDIVQQNKF